MTTPTYPDGTDWTTGYPIFKFGARWVCDGPEGRFHARTKSEAIQMLADNAGLISP